MVAGVAFGRKNVFVKTDIGNFWGGGQSLATAGWWNRSQFKSVAERPVTGNAVPVF